MLKISKAIFNFRIIKFQSYNLIVMVGSERKCQPKRMIPQSASFGYYVGTCILHCRPNVGSASCHSPFENGNVKPLA